jgi:hypothetical protein
VIGGQTEVAKAGLIAFALVTSAVLPIKVVVGRVRPGAAIRMEAAGQATELSGSESKSFPSGDSATAFAVATVVAMFTGRKWGAAAMVVAGYVGFLRVMANAHYPSDVLAGAALGVLCGAAAMKVNEWWTPENSPQAYKLRLPAMGLLVVLPLMGLRGSDMSWVVVFLGVYMPLMAGAWLYMRSKAQQERD